MIVEPTFGLRSSFFLIFLLTLLLGTVLGGCVSAGYQGLVPGKDVHLKNFKQEVYTPWGRSVITADELTTVIPAAAPVVVPR